MILRIRFANKEASVTNLIKMFLKNSKKKLAFNPNNITKETI